MLALHALAARWARCLRALSDSSKNRCPRKPRVQPYVEELEPRTVPSLMGNALFPADNPWNEKIAGAPVAANSATLVNAIGAGSAFHPDFGTMWAGANNGIPFNVVAGTQLKVQVIVDDYPSESDLVPVPIPNNAVIEGDPLPSSQNTSDRHLIVYDQDNNVAYEMFHARKPAETGDGKWHAANIAFWDMRQNWFRTPGDTSADAAGLPILPGLVRPDEVLDQGRIDHALRFTVPSSGNAYVYPASHQAGVNNVNLPRLGERFRLKASFDISAFSPANRVILQALKDYGMIVADNGGPWFISGQPSSRWNDDELSQLKSLKGSDFEAVDLTPRLSRATAPGGTVTSGTVVTITGLNFSGGAGKTQVFFGNSAAASLTVVSDTQIRATAPTLAGSASTVFVISPYGTSNTVTIGTGTSTKLETLVAGDGQVFGFDANGQLWRYRPADGSWLAAGAAGTQVVVANVGDGNAANDVVFFLGSDNRLWLWNQQTVTSTGGWLKQITAGDNQVFGVGMDSQVWRYHVAAGWRASGGWGVAIDVGNKRNRNAADDLVFLRGADNRIWVWNQQGWTNTGGWLASIVAGDDQVFGLGMDQQVWRYRVRGPQAGWRASGGYGVEIDVGTIGDRDATNDMVYLRTSDNRLWTWSQWGWTNTGGRIASVVAGDGQVFGKGLDAQVWRYRPGAGWRASGGGAGDHLVLGNLGDKSPDSDLAFLLAVDKTVDCWNQTSWQNSAT